MPTAYGPLILHSKVADGSALIRLVFKRACRRGFFDPLVVT